MNEKVRDGILKIPCLTPLDLTVCVKKELEGSTVISVENLVKINHKLFEIKDSLYRVGLEDGFINDTNLLNKRVYGILSDHAGVLIGGEFKEKIRKEKGCLSDDSLYEEYNKSVLVRPSSKLIYYNLLVGVLCLYLYVLSLHLSRLVELNGIELVRELKSDFRALSNFFYSRLQPSLRSKMSKNSPKIRQQILAGYDTEYKNVAYGVNKLVSAQLSLTGNLVLEITKRTPYEFETLHTVTQESLKTETKNVLKGLGICLEGLINNIEESIGSVRSLKYGNYDELVSSLVEKLKGDKSITSEESQLVKGKCIFVTSKLPGLRRLLIKKDVGLNWESLLSEITEGSGLKEKLDLEVKKLSEKINGGCEGLLLKDSKTV